MVTFAETAPLATPFRCESIRDSRGEIATNRNKYKNYGYRVPGG